MTGRAILVAAALLTSHPARAGELRAGAAEDRERAIQCLATAIGYEAAYEPVEGQQAVAEVVLNRVRHPAYPSSVCAVVFQGSERRTGCQFSFTCDGSMRRPLPARVVEAARTIAAAALDGASPLRAAGATHYHADYVSPYWAPSLIRLRKIGAHIFYRGAGARDQALVAARFTPADEPEVDIAARPSAAAQPAPSAPPPVFAPWGLTR